MTRYAQIDRGVVVSFPPVVPGFAFEKCYDAAFRARCVVCDDKMVKVGWTFDGARFAPPPEPEGPTLEEARTAKIDEISTGYETVIAYVQAGYPDKEVLTWERQATQARELQADPDAEALFVRALAAAKGVDVPEMCRRIMINARNWEPVVAMLTAQCQLMQEAAEAAESIEAVQAIKVSYSV